MSNSTVRKLLAILIISAFSLSSVPFVFAEDIGRETETVRRETWDVRRSDKVAATSEAKAIEDKYKTGVTYEDILKDPDNINLNFRYAQNQIANGELLGASATLERILLVNPNLADVRLLYAVVLYRLDSLNEAQKELDLLKSVPLPAKIRNEVNQYQKRIKFRKKRTRFGVRESLGWGYDTNRNAAPHSKQLLAFNTALDAQGSNVQRGDTHFTNITTVDVNHDLGFQAGHSVFASFTYFLQRQTKVHSLNLGSFQYEVGGTYKSKYFNFTPSFFASHIFLSDQSFLRSQGGNFLFDRDINKKLNVFYNFRIERQDYMNISENNTATDRKGPQIDNLWGVNYTIIPTMRWTSCIGYSHKFAKQTLNAYDRISLNNTHTWIWPKGQFVINTLNAYFDNYDSPDFSVANRIRHDKSVRYRFTYGAPLETLLIGKIFPKPFKDIVFTFSYEYYHALSNITNYTYTNNKMEGLFTKRFEF